MTYSLTRDETDYFRLFRGWDNCSLLAPHTKYGIRASCILCWLLASAAVIYTHAETFLRQTQNSLTIFDQLPLRAAYIILLGLVWLLQEVLFDYKQG